MASPLEVAFLLANLRAVGLMPDSDFQRIKPGLIELIRKSVYRESQMSEAEISIAQFIDESVGATDAPPFDEWSSHINDTELWKHVISIFLTLEREVGSGSETSLAQFLVSNDDIELDMIFDGDCLPTSPLSTQQPGLFDNLGLQAYEMNRGASREALANLSEKVRVLEREIADLRGRSIRSDFRDDHAAPHIHSRDAEDERAKKSKIAELQRDLQRELRSAELHASKGETFSAGSARGRAARIESMLRALGA